MTLIEELADWEDGKLAPQNNYLPGVWIPGSFIDQRERSNEELKSKGRIERERQWASKVKGSSVFQNISKGMSSLWKRCVNLFYSQVGRDKLSFPQLNKGILVYQAEGQGPPGKPLSMIIIIKAVKSKSKKQLPTWSQNWLPPCNTTGEGNGNPLQCFCLENPRDGGAWWAAVYGSHRVGHDWSGLAGAVAAATQPLTGGCWKPLWKRHSMSKDKGEAEVRL